MSPKDRLIALLKGKRILFVGIGVSNTKLIGMLADEGLTVSACDRRSPTQLGSVCQTLEAKGVRLLLDENYPDLFRADVLIRTPGMYFYSPELMEFRSRGGIVTSEMELFFQFCPCPVIAITGSDGKTTTSTLTAELLRAQGYHVHLGGNIGRALLPELDAIQPTHRAVVELSSFQLISMRCAPDTAVVTNVSPNHLDVHRSMEEYIDTKRNLCIHQNAFSTTVLSADNPISYSFSPLVRGRRKLFSLQRPVDHGAYLGRDGVLRRVDYGKEVCLLHQDEIRLPGIHNVSNLLAAVCAAGDLVQPETIALVAKEFAGVEHRMELVRTLGGVKWYNDSIATSPTRAMAGLASFDQKIILIAGGYDKNLSYDSLAPALVEKVRLLILMGKTADKVEASLLDCPSYSPGHPDILRARDLAEAVDLAWRAAGAGDIVSLSPASASFDSYPNFEARGRHFKELVMGLS